MGQEGRSRCPVSPRSSPAGGGGGRGWRALRGRAGGLAGGLAGPRGVQEQPRAPPGGLGTRRRARLWASASQEAPGRVRPLQGEGWTPCRSHGASSLLLETESPRPRVPSGRESQGQRTVLMPSGLALRCGQRRTSGMGTGEGRGRQDDSAGPEGCRGPSGTGAQDPDLMDPWPPNGPNRGFLRPGQVACSPALSGLKLHCY